VPIAEKQQHAKIIISSVVGTYALRQLFQAWEKMEEEAVRSVKDEGSLSKVHDSN
jgi:hypothetical protein